MTEMNPTPGWQNNHAGRFLVSQMFLMKYPHTPIPTAHRGFSLIELVIVVVIIGIIGAVAIPRMSRGSQGAATSALVRNLSIMNKAIDHYAAEHDGNFPTQADIEVQLTSKTKADGTPWSNGDAEPAFGPYVRDIPPLPLGDRKGNTVISNSDGDDVGWIYSPLRGIVRPNLHRSNGTTDESLVTVVISNTILKRDDLVKP